VLLTTNFSLTYFTVSGEGEASRVPSWLCIMDVEGLSVLTAWAAGKFVPEKIAPFIKKSGVVDKVKHRKLVIPGYLAQISGELQEELGDWQVLVGPREAGDIPAFLKGWSVS
jgi:acetyl-CoA decarbonylase/synthase complex subunit gamma